MINLLRTNIDVKEALKAHGEFFCCYLTQRVFGNLDEKKCKRYKTHFPKRERSSSDQDFFFLINFIFENMEGLICGTPEKLLEINENFVNAVNLKFGENSYSNYFDNMGSEIVTKFFKDLENIINYTWFNSLEPSEDYSAYHLTSNLRVRACVYCNRIYTITHNTKKNGKLMRPQLDHWLPESKYPLLAISFYNLIPSCYHCNSSVKGSMVLDFTVHSHPYILDVNSDDFHFSYEFDENTDNYNIFVGKSLLASGKLMETIRQLKIDEMYNAHIPELEDLLLIEKAYSKEYLKSLRIAFPEANLSDQEIYRLAFGTELDEINFHQRPMSKFKKDILKELNIIK